MHLDAPFTVYGAAEEVVRHRKTFANATSGFLQNFSIPLPGLMENKSAGVVSLLPNATTTARVCDQWEGTQSILLQGANLCYVAAFLIPHKFYFSVFVVRALLTVGFFLATLWTGFLVCGPDVLAWNLALFLINFSHTVYLSYKYCPPRIDPELYELYSKVFTPLKVQKKHFKELIRDADIQSLDPDEHYAMEGITAADQRLSILLSGKMKATCEEVLLHYVLPTEFVDSPEWESCRSDSDKLFQVTLTATERCKLVSWRRLTLESVLKNNRFLDVILYNLIGKDITHKLYSLNEHHRADDVKLSYGAFPDWWRHQIPKSQSVDAVYTGTKGHVRSIIWRNQDRRISAAQSESLGIQPTIRRDVER